MSSNNRNRQELYWDNYRLQRNVIMTDEQLKLATITSSTNIKLKYTEQNSYFKYKPTNPWHKIYKRDSICGKINVTLYRWLLLRQIASSVVVATNDYDLSFDI